MPLGAFRLNSIAKAIGAGAPPVTGSSLFTNSGTTTTRALSDSNYTFGTGDFTIEAWVYLEETIGGYVFSHGTSFGDASNLRLLYDSGDQSYHLRLGGTWYESTESVSLNTWHHVAVTRSSGTLRFFVDGTKLTSIGSSGDITFSTDLAARPMALANLSYANVTPWQGYIDEFRISSTARYTSNFTPPTAEFTNDVNTLTLLHMDDDGGGDIDDDNTGATTVTANGNAQVDTAQSKFGGASALFDGTGDYLSTDKNIGDFGDGAFTVEAWVRTASSAGTFENIAGIWHGSTAGNRSWFLGVDDNTQHIVFYWYDTSNNIDTSMESSGSIANTTWTHVAISSDGTTFRLFLNGVEEDTATAEAIRTPVAGSSLTMGANYDGTLPFNGHLDEVRISNIARYTSGFTPPSTAFTTDNNTLLLLHMDGTDGSTTFDNDGSIIRSGIDYTLSGAATFDTTTFKF